MTSHRFWGLLTYVSFCIGSTRDLAQNSVAQRPYQALQPLHQVRGQATANTRQLQRPIKFAGWNRRNLLTPAYREKFSRPRARLARPEQIASAAHPVGQSYIQSASVLPSSLPGFLFRKALPAGYFPTSVATGDFNGDGKMDFVVANGGDNDLWLYLGNGDGTFALPVILPITRGLTPVWVSAVDLRGIGKLDLVVAEADSNSLGIFLGNGNGTFNEIAVALPGSPSVLITGDFNRDGKVDVVAAYADGNPTAVSVLPGLGNGSFGSPINTSIVGLGSAYFWLSTADLNGDGIPDLVATSGLQDNAVQVLMGNGDGTFSAGQVIAQNFQNQNLSTALFDADEDGKIDAIVVDSFGALWFYQGNGDGSFSTNPKLFGVGDVPFGIGVADVDGDGHLDVVVSGVFVDGWPYGASAGNLTCVLLGDGKGNFSPAKVYRGDLSAFSLAIADFNGDGHPDIVTANQDSDSAVVFLNDGKGGFGDPQGGFIGYEGGGAVNAPLTEIVSTDVNGDGFPDLALIEYPQLPSTSYQLTVMLNDGTGHYSLPIRSDAIDTTFSPWFGDFVLADFRNTGQPDFLAIGIDGGLGGKSYISFAANQGGGHFGAPALTFPPNAIGKIGVGDFNGDGKPDFVAVGEGGIINSSSQSAQVFLGNGDGTFRTGGVQSFGGAGLGFPAAVYVGDFNNDGKLDLIVFFESNAGWTTNDDVYELVGNGDGTFQPAQLLFSHFGPMNMADLNHDSHLDVIQSSFAFGNFLVPIPSEFSSYLDKPNGAFSLTATYNSYLDENLIPQLPIYFNSHYAPMVADFNGDGNPDIAAFQRGNEVVAPSSVVQFLLGNGDGTFTPSYSLFDFQKYYFPDLGADVTGDGRADLIELDGFRSSFHVLPAIPGPAFQLNLVADPVVGRVGKAIVTLAVPSSGSTAINVTASDPAIQVPATVTIPAGTISQVFSFNIGSAFNARHVFSLTAQLGTEAEIAYGTQLAPRAAGFTLSFSPSLDLAAGQVSPSLSLLAFSQNGYGTTLSFKCLGLPSQAQCQFNPPTVSLPPGATSSTDVVVSVAGNAVEGSYAATMEGTDGVLTYDFPFTLNVGDFSMSITPSSVQMFPTDIASARISLTSIFSYGQPVYLSCSVPAGIQCGVPPFDDPLPIGSNDTLSLQTQATPVGNYQVTVSGTSAPLSHSISAQLQVWDFNSSVTPLSTTMKAGSSANFTVNVDSVNGFNGSVNLLCTTSVGGITCTFNPSTLTVVPGVTSTSALTIAVAPGLATRKQSSVGSFYASFVPFVVTFLLCSRKHTARRFWSSIGLLMILGLVSCGGGTNSGGNGGGGGGGGGTRHYTVTVQAGSGVNYVKTAGAIHLSVN